MIGLTDISPGNVLRISISGSAINNTSGTLGVKLVEPRSSKILKRFTEYSHTNFLLVEIGCTKTVALNVRCCRRSPVERPQQRTFNATVLVQPISTSKKFVCEYSAPSGEQAYFEFNVIFMFELIKIV